MVLWVDLATTYVLLPSGRAKALKASGPTVVAPVGFQVSMSRIVAVRSPVAGSNIQFPL